MYLSPRAFAPHRHDVYAIGLTTGGVQTFRYRGSRRVCLPGQLHVLHPDETHDGAAATDDGFVAAWLGAAIGSGTDLVLVSGANSLDPLDPVLLAIGDVGGEVSRPGVPAHPGSMVWIGTIGRITALGIATCSGFGKNTSLDVLLARLLAGEEAGPRGQRARPRRIPRRPWRRFALPGVRPRARIVGRTGVRSPPRELRGRRVRAMEGERLRWHGMENGLSGRGLERAPPGIPVAASRRRSVLAPARCPNAPRSAHTPQRGPGRARPGRGLGIHLRADDREPRDDPFVRCGLLAARLAAGAGGGAGIALVAGVLFGSALWWLTLALGVGSLRERVGEGALSLVNCVAGVITTLFSYVATLRAGEDVPAPEGLTPREQEILALMAEGLSNKESAERLVLQPQTVKNYAHLVMQKLGLRSRLELIRSIRTRKRS